MRLIDLDEFLRQNCIDRIEGKSCEECNYHVLEVSCERLMGQPTIDLVKWIPTTEKLPSEGKNVLLCSTLFGNVAIGKLIRYNTSCCWEVDHWDCDIEDWQAWMPLPEPWRGEE